MGPIQLLLLSVLLFGLAALMSLVLRKLDRAARTASGLLGMLASVVGCMAAVQVFVTRACGA